MKKILMMMILINSSFVIAKEDPVESCIAAYSGAESVECLKKIYSALNQELDQLNQTMLLSLEYRDKEDIITVNHYTSALRAFKRSILDFTLYRESSCHFRTYYSGAVASGYGQILYSCLIKQTEIRTEYLKSILKP